MVVAIEQLVKVGPLVPVIVIDQLEDAIPLAESLLAGGVSVLEVTLRTDCALQAIERIAKELPEAIVGAGTLKNGQDVKAALDHGAQFGVSPGLTTALHEAATTHGLPLLPGVATSSEVLAARDMGYRHLKLFPAEIVGGVALLKAWSSVFGDMKFCPTGGLSADLAPSYLRLPNVVCVGGSWFVPTDAIRGKRWADITALTRQALSLC